MNLQIVKHNLNKRIEEYNERIFILVNSFQRQANDHLLNFFFKAGLLPYLQVATTSMERGMLILHFEATIICEERSLMLMVIGSYWMYIPNDERGKKKVTKTPN
jgi:Mg2+ and Co2+ transporter CorA